MIIDGFILRTKTDPTPIQSWATIPARIALPNGDVVFGATNTWTDGNYKIVASSISIPDPPVPTPTLTARQARLAINTVPGLRTQVEGVVAASDQNTKDYWEYSSELHRDHPLLNNLANQVGLTSKQVDDLFALGQGL